MAKVPGKKIGPLWIDLNGQRIQLDLRVDTRNGRFYTEHEGQVFDAATVDELRAKAAPAVEVSQGLTWTRYIVIDYQSTDAASSRSWNEDRDLTDKPPAFVKAIRLHWTVKDFSNKHVPTRCDEEVILERDVLDDGTTDLPSVASRTHGRGPHRKHATLPDGAILYTPEREAALRDIRMRMTALDRQLRAVLAGDPAEVGTRLEQLPSATLQLPAPLPPVKPEPDHETWCAKHDGEGCDCGAEEAA